MKISSIVATVTVAVVLLAPAPLLAQRRAPSDDGGSEPARTASGRSSDSESAPRAEPAPRSEPAPRAEPASRSEGGAPAPRAVAARGGDQSKARPAASQAPVGSRTAAARRTTAERPAVGVAVPRRFVAQGPVRILSPVYIPTYRYGYGYGYPYGYGPWGYGFGLGFSYAPFAYGYRPGYGYGYGYRPHYGYPIYYGPGYSGSAGEYREDEPEDAAEVPTGSIRFRANPAHARIYINGALAGLVEDYNGLSDHLQLKPGPYTYELRADGYRTHSGALTVVEGQTRTERVNLQKQ